MAGIETREARWLAHKEFDLLWKRDGLMSRDGAYNWMANVLHIPYTHAHIGMLTKTQCELLVGLAQRYRRDAKKKPHWKQRTKKKRRN